MIIAKTIEGKGLRLQKDKSIDTLNDFLDKAAELRNLH